MKKELPTKKNFRIMALIQKFKKEWPARNLPGTILAAQKFLWEIWRLWSKWRRCIFLLMKFWIRWCLRDIKKIVLNSTLGKAKQCLIAKLKTKGCSERKTNFFETSRYYILFQKDLFICIIYIYHDWSY